ncbi:MAG: ABC transporter permease [Hyphomicrobiaceae bacterium]
MRGSTTLYLPLLQFLIRYRRTALGPFWLMVGPTLFIGGLGLLLAEIGGVPPPLFMPHLAVGYILWTFISAVVVGSPTIFVRAHAQIMQGEQTLDEIVVADNVTHVVAFAHQVPVLIAVLLIYHVPLSLNGLMSLLGLAFIVANGIWVSQVFGILGARYRDLAEVLSAIMSIAFLATPIIWMPGEGIRGGAMGAFLLYNPFSHFLEVTRGPLLGNPVAPLSWAVVIVITFAGFALARFMMRRYARFVPLWV